MCYNVCGVYISRTFAISNLQMLTIVPRTINPAKIITHAVYCLSMHYNHGLAHCTLQLDHMQPDWLNIARPQCDEWLWCLQGLNRDNH